MVDINVGNILTIGLIGLGFYAAFKFGAHQLGYNPSWL